MHPLRRVGEVQVLSGRVARDDARLGGVGFAAPPAVLTVKDVMSPRLLVLQANASIGRAQAEMRLARIRHFPVVNKADELIGVVSERDLFRAIGAGPKGKSLAVGQIMTTQIQTVQAAQPAHEAARLMRSHKIGMLPVVTSGQRLVGIVTETDFLAIAERALAGKRLGDRRRKPAQG